MFNPEDRFLTNTFVNQIVTGLIISRLDRFKQGEKFWLLTCLLFLARYRVLKCHHYVCHPGDRQIYLCATSLEEVPHLIDGEVVTQAWLFPVFSLRGPIPLTPGRHELTWVGGLSTADDWRTRC